MLKRVISIIAISAFSTSAYAMLCPTNFNEIKAGNTLQQVEDSCGKPDSEKTYDGQSNAPQEWTYYIQMSPTNQASLRTTVAFDANGKVTNMSVNGIGVSSTAICNGANITVGDTQDTIKRACGKPAFVNQSNQGNSAPAVKMTDIIYNSATNPVTLTFENGVLK